MCFVVQAIGFDSKYPLLSGDLLQIADSKDQAKEVCEYRNLMISYEYQRSKAATALQEISEKQAAKSSGASSVVSEGPLIPTSPAEEPDQKVIRLVLKTDCQGTMEILLDSFSQINEWLELLGENIVVKVVKHGHGPIVLTEAQLAVTANVPIVAFKVSMDPSVQRSSDSSLQNLKVFHFDLFYNLLAFLQERLNELGSTLVLKKSTSEGLDLGL